MKFLENNFNKPGVHPQLAVWCAPGLKALCTEASKKIDMTEISSPHQWESIVTNPPLKAPHYCSYVFDMAYCLVLN